MLLAQRILGRDPALRIFSLRTPTPIRRADPSPRISFLCAAPSGDTDVRDPITHATRDARERAHEAIGRRDPEIFGFAGPGAPRIFFGPLRTDPSKHPRVSNAHETLPLHTDDADVDLAWLAHVHAGSSGLSRQPCVPSGAPTPFARRHRPLTVQSPVADGPLSGAFSTRARPTGEPHGGGQRCARDLAPAHLARLRLRTP